MSRPPPKFEHELFAPVFASIIVIVNVIVFGSVTIIIVIVMVIEVILALSDRNVFGFDIQH